MGSLAGASFALLAAMVALPHAGAIRDSFEAEASLELRQDVNQSVERVRKCCCRSYKNPALPVCFWMSRELKLRKCPADKGYHDPNYWGVGEGEAPCQHQASTTEDESTQITVRAYFVNAAWSCSDALHQQYWEFYDALLETLKEVNLLDGGTGGRGDSMRGAAMAAAKKYREFPDSPLTDVGVRRTRVIGERIRPTIKEEIAKLGVEWNWEDLLIFSSDLVKTMETARHLFPGLAVHPIPYLSEHGDVPDSTPGKYEAQLEKYWRPPAEMEVEGWQVHQSGSHSGQYAYYQEVDGSRYRKTKFFTQDWQNFPNPESGWKLEPSSSKLGMFAFYVTSEGSRERKTEYFHLKDDLEFSTAAPKDHLDRTSRKRSYSTDFLNYFPVILQELLALTSKPIVRDMVIPVVIVTDANFMEQNLRCAHDAYAKTQKLRAQQELQADWAQKANRNDPRLIELFRQQAEAARPKNNEVWVEEYTVNHKRWDSRLSPKWNSKRLHYPMLYPDAPKRLCKEDTQRCFAYEDGTAKRPYAPAHWQRRDEGFCMWLETQPRTQEGVVKRDEDNGEIYLRASPFKDAVPPIVSVSMHVHRATLDIEVSGDLAVQKVSSGAMELQDPLSVIREGWKVISVDTTQIRSVEDLRSKLKRQKNGWVIVTFSTGTEPPSEGLLHQTYKEKLALAREMLHAAVHMEDSENVGTSKVETEKEKQLKGALKLGWSMFMADEDPDMKNARQELRKQFGGGKVIDKTTGVALEGKVWLDGAKQSLKVTPEQAQTPPSGASGVSSASSQESRESLQKVLDSLDSKEATADKKRELLTNAIRRAMADHISPEDPVLAEAAAKLKEIWQTEDEWTSMGATIPYVSAEGWLAQMWESMRKPVGASPLEEKDEKDLPERRGSKRGRGGRQGFTESTQELLASTDPSLLQAKESFDLVTQSGVHLEGDATEQVSPSRDKGYEQVDDTFKKQ